MVPFLRRLVLLILLAPATPVLAQSVTLGDGFYNIAGDPEVGTEASYGSAGGWSVVAGFAGNTFAFCAAQTVGPDGTWRFGYDAGGQWQMALLQPFAGDTPHGSLDFDGHVSGIAGWGDGSWVILWLGLGEYEAIGSGNQVTVDLGPIQARLPLRGTAAAGLKVQECVSNRGVPPRGASAAAAMPDPSRPGEEMVGNCRTPYESYRCMAAVLTPTGRFAEAYRIRDAFGSAPTFIVQTDRADLSQVWVSFGQGEPFRYLGEWVSDGHCRQPRPNQPPAVQAALGHDAWSLCID